MIGAPSRAISKVAHGVSGMSRRAAQEKQNVPHCETSSGVRIRRSRWSGPLPRAGGRARTCARHWRVPGESEPHAGGDVDGLGRGSKPGLCCACIRPPSQPVLQTAPSQGLDSAAGVLGPLDPSTAGRRPCPGEGAIPACRCVDDLSRCRSFLRDGEQRAPPGLWEAQKNSSPVPSNRACNRAVSIATTFAGWPKYRALLQPRSIQSSLSAS